MVAAPVLDLALPDIVLGCPPPHRSSFRLWTSVCPTTTFSSSWPSPSPSRRPARRCLRRALLLRGPPAQPETASNRRARPSSVRQPWFWSSERRLVRRRSSSLIRLLCAGVSTEGQLTRLQDLGFRKEDCRAALLHCKGGWSPEAGAGTGLRRTCPHRSAGPGCRLAPGER